MDCGVVHLDNMEFKPMIQGSRGFTAETIKVDFHKLLGNSEASDLVPQVVYRDILCSVLGLFEVCLPVAYQDIYKMVHSHGAQAIILLRQHSEVLEEYRSRTLPNPPGEHGNSPVPSPIRALGNGNPGLYRQLLKVLNESEESCEDSSDEHEEEDCTEPSCHCAMLEGFLTRAQERKAQRESTGDHRQLPPTAVGAESLIIGAAVFQLRTLSKGITVLQLCLMATRKRYQNSGVGGSMIELLKNKSVCGAYDALLAHVDAGAVSFFKHCGFTDDPLINDVFREVRDDWINRTLMIYLPPFTTESASQIPGFSLIMPELEEEVEIAMEDALSAYQQQAVCVTRLVREIKTLRVKLELQRRELVILKGQLGLGNQLKMACQLLDKQRISDSDNPDQNGVEPSSEAVSTPPNV
ncbi:hypothetical protein UPYG_G00264340 [Umbra pygmaea]|uniref:Uncharacterized protein n=1 Tax=Umbra pygmaea TaxID=75934 RepID=A0ABD0WEE4_UMBPY